MTIKVVLCGWETNIDDEWDDGLHSSNANPSATAALTGSYGLLLNPSADDSHTSYLPGFAVQHSMIWSFSFQYPSLPGEDHQLFGSAAADTGTCWSGRFRESDSRLVLEARISGVANETIEGPVLEAATRYDVQLYYRGQSYSDTSTRRQMSMIVNGVDYGTIGPNASYNGSWNTWQFGVNSNHTYTAYVDDVFIVMGFVSTDEPDIDGLWPLGPIIPQYLSPAGVGTHVNSGSFTASTGTLANSWQLIDELPFTAPPASDYVQQENTGTGDYLEYILESFTIPTGQAVVGACLYAMLDDSGVGTTNQEIHAVSDGTDNTLFDGGAGNGLSDPFTLPGIAGTVFGTSAWDQTALDGTLIRWGYSSDVTPKPRLDALAVLLALTAPPEVPEEAPDPETVVAPDGDWIYFDQLEAFDGGEVVTTPPPALPPPVVDDTTTDVYTFSNITPQANAMMLVFGQTVLSSSGAEVPISVAHAGLDSGFGLEAEGQVFWDTISSPDRATWLWAAATGAAPSTDDLVVTFDNAMDGCSIVVAYATNYEPTDPLGAFAAAVNSDPSVATITPDLGSIDAGSSVYAGLGFNNIAGVNPLAMESWVLVESASQITGSLDTLLALPGVVGISLAQPWDQFETSSGVYDYTSLNAVKAKTDAAGKKLAFRIRAGQHTPSFARGRTWVPTTGQAAGLTLPNPCETSGAINATFYAAYQAMFDDIEAWAISNGLDILHLTWFGGKSAELYETDELRTLTGDTGANISAAHIALLDYAQALSSSFAIEFPIGGFQATGSSLRSNIIADMNANGRAQYLQMNNLTDNTYILWPYAFKPHGLQMLHPDPPAPRTDEWDWSEVYPNAKQNKATYVEIPWKCWTQNTNKAQLYQQAAATSAGGSEGTLLGTATRTDIPSTLAVFAAGENASPTLVWNTASRAGAVAIEVKKKKTDPVTPNVPPNAALTVTPTSGSSPLSVTADASASTDADGTIKTYQFSWGDGTIGAKQTTPTASHTYTGAQVATVRVSVTDNSGAVDTAEDTVTVTGTPPTIPALLTGVLSRGTYSSSIGPDGYNPEISWATLEPTEGSLVTTALDNAIASGHPFRLRLEAGLGTPSWVKTATGSVTVVNPQSGIRGTVAKWWTATYLTKWTNFVDALAALYTSSDIKLVFSAACMTVYAEPCLRGFSNTETLDNLRAAGLTAGNDIAAQKNTTDALAAAFSYARIGMAFNPYQLITATTWKTDEATTYDLMSYFRGMYGKRFVLQNNSLRDYSQGAQYDLMYDQIRALGKPFSFQTATWSRVAAPGETNHQGLINTLDKAIAWGAHAVEMPSGHDLNGTQLTTYGNALDANA